MRTLACLVLVATFFVAGCNSASSDPCKGIAGTCVSLTVQSSTVATVDSLHIVASGALTGDQTSSGGRANLPIVVALKLPANTAGSLDLHVDGFLTATLVGSCDTDTLVTPGQHASAICTLVGLDNGGIDMSTGGVGDMTGAGSDMTIVACDPKGVTGPQCQWRWQTPLPQGDDIKSVVAFGDSDTFALTNNNLVLHRDSTQWTVLATGPTAAPFQSLDTLFSSGGNSMDLFIGGNGSSSSAPVMYHSPDRGASWTKEPMPTGALGFIGDGATVGSYAVLPSSNGGGLVFVRDGTTGTWSSVSTGASVSYRGAAMNFSGAVVVGSGAGTTGSIAYATNSTYTTWAPVPPANITPAAANVAYSGVCVGNSGAANSNWAVGFGVIIHGSGNQPSAWTQQGSAVTTGVSLQGCVATDALHAWAFGTSGVVLATSDGGTTWAGVAAPPTTSETLSAGAHSSGAALTLAGTRGVLFRSTNGGASFTGERSGPSDNLSAAFGPAAKTVFAVGPAGTIYTTTDSGATWTKLAAPAATGTTAVLNAVWGASATDVYAVGGMGTIVHSSNGTTFTKYAGANAPTATTTMYDVFGSPAVGVFAVGTDGSGATQTRIVLRSTDQGVSWTPVTIAGFTGAPAAGAYAHTVFALGSDVWIGGDNLLIYHSTGGVTFAAENTGTGGAIVIQLRGVSGHLIGSLNTDPGTYIDSLNGGTTWTSPTTSPWGGGGEQVVFVPDQSAIYVFGAFSPPAASYDKAATWVPLTTAMNPSVMRGGFAFAGNDVFVVGDTGIIHYGN